jgi:hypothetical protein
MAVLSSGAKIWTRSSSTSDPRGVARTPTEAEVRAAADRVK